MKYDVLAQIDDFLKRRNLNVLDDKYRNFVEELNDAGFPELSGFSIGTSVSDYELQYLEKNRLIGSNVNDNGVEIYLYEEDDSIHIYTEKFDTVYDANEGKIVRLVYYNNKDTVAITYDSKSKTYKVKLYIDGYYGYHTNWIPNSAIPELTCEIKKGHNTDEYSDCYYVIDPSKRITDDDKPIRFGTGDNVEEELAPQDLYSEVRTFRAIGDRVLGLYREKYYFNSKKRVLSKTKAGQVRLDG